MFTTDQAIFVLATLLFVGVLTTKFSTRFGLPYLVLFIAVGMGLNRFVLFSDVRLSQLLGTLALIVILFNGGLHTKWSHVKKVIGPSISLATIGVLVTTVLIGACAKYILHVTWLEGLLLGAIVGSTDAAAVFAVLGNKNIKKRLTATLEAESGTNDPMAVFLTLSLVELIQDPHTSYLTLLMHFVIQMGLGLVMGLVVGKLAVMLINKINLDASGMYPAFSLAFAIFSYSASALLEGSGLLAVYVTALFIGNQDVIYRFTITRFNEGFSWMMQIFMFILLGLTVFPAQLIGIAWEGLALSFLLMLIARPVGVLVSLLFAKYTFAEKIFIAWAGLKGAVPIVLATYPLLGGLEHSPLFFNVVFFIVLTSALIQGSTLSFLAKALRLEEEGSGRCGVRFLDLIPVGRANLEIMEIRIVANTSVEGKELQELQLPGDTLMTTIMRGREIITPKGDTRLERGDLLYLFVSKQNREEVSCIFAPEEQEEANA